MTIYRSNNKVGQDFEHEFCEMLYDNGFWVHFIERKKSGSQPFDIIASKNNIAFVFDAKTNSGNLFRLSRIEENQIESMTLFNDRGNKNSFIVIKKDDCDIYIIPFSLVLNEIENNSKSLKLSELNEYKITDKGRLPL